MAKEKKDSSGAAGKTVELKDKATGFFDPETGLKIVHEEKVKLEGTVGRKTNRALLSGALLIVGSPEAKAAAAEAKPNVKAGEE